MVQRLVWLAWAPDLGMACHGDSRTTLDTPLPESLPEAKKLDFTGCERLHACILRLCCELNLEGEGNGHMELTTNEQDTMRKDRKRNALAGGFQNPLF